MARTLTATHAFVQFLYLWMIFGSLLMGGPMALLFAILYMVLFLAQTYAPASNQPPIDAKGAGKGER